MTDRQLAGVTRAMLPSGHGPAEALLSSRVLEWASHFDDADRILLHLDRTGQHSCRRIAELTGLHPGTVVRRLRRLRTLLQNPAVIALLDDPGELSIQYRQVGLARWVQRRPLAWISREFALTRREVLSILSFLEDWPSVRPRRQQA